MLSTGGLGGGNTDMHAVPWKTSARWGPLKKKVFMFPGLFDLKDDEGTSVESSKN